MSRDGIPTGAQFRSQVVVTMTLFSLPTLLGVGALGWALLRLTPEMWWSLLGAIGFYVVAASPLNHMALVRLMRPITEWLDGAEGREAAERGFVAIMHFPGRIAVAAAAGWLVPTVLVSLALTWRHPAAWGSWESLVLLCAGASAGSASAILMTFHTRAGRFADVRNALAAAVGGPDRRGQLAPRVSMRTKTLATVSVVAIVPVLLATLIGARQAEHSLERFALGWTDQMLAGLPAEGAAGAVQRLRAELDSTPLPVGVSLLPLERFESGLAEEVREGIRAAAERGARQGDSSHLPSSRVFSWRALEDGSVWVASVDREELFAHGTVSGLALVALLLVSLGFALGTAWLLARDITEPAAILREAADRLALGDLRTGHLYESSDELGELSRSFEIMGVSLSLTIGALTESADDVERQAGELTPVCRNLSSATSEQVEGMRRAAESMEEIRAQVKGIAESSQGLAVSIEESSSSVLELGATGQELNETANVLNSKVEEVSASIEQMAAAVKQISRNTETLSSAVEQNSASMEEMASSLRQVDSAAEEAAQLSRSVVERSEIGRAKVRETIEGMEAIREATDTVEEVIRTLHGRAGEIGAVVDVIDSVADETNLLALNAAIIAAQSGEHGRAFGVVADEIKDLAERVLASTKEIGGLILSVQEESGRARGAIERGSASVASGVDLSAEAGLALEEITEASRRSGERIDAIVSALREQAKAAGHVVELMESVSDGVEEIRRAAVEQDRGNDVVSSSAVTMREVAQQVRGATEEQARGASRIRDSVESVRVAIEQINQALQEQSGACESAASYLEEVQGRSSTHEAATATVEGVVRELKTRAEALRTEVGRFQT